MLVSMISREDVIKVANLARVHVEESEFENIRKKMEQILGAFESLALVPTHDIVPTFHGISQLQMRQDHPESSLDRAWLEKNAPEFFEGSFKLPRVLGSET